MSHVHAHRRTRNGGWEELQMAGPPCASGDCASRRYPSIQDLFSAAPETDESLGLPAGTRAAILGAIKPPRKCGHCAANLTEVDEALGHDYCVKCHGEDDQDQDWH